MRLDDPRNAAVVSAGFEASAETEAAGHDVVFEINLSAKPLVDERLTDHISSEITRTGVNPRSLMFEVTETEAIINIDRARPPSAWLSR
ncbi:MAG: EAL domain-containing protein [Actinobacteria bacterium]|nr:EAL domain-containing protein [Actinomycetota bacterium]